MQFTVIRYGYFPLDQCGAPIRVVGIWTDIEFRSQYGDLSISGDDFKWSFFVFCNLEISFSIQVHGSVVCRKLYREL